MTTDQTVDERGPWAIEPELPPDPTAVQRALFALWTEAEAHATEARDAIDRLSRILTAEPTAQAEHLAATRRLAAAEQTAVDVRVALARVEDGTYGLCARCGEAIAPARLEMRPASRYCVECT
jgi:RNA polymerase-binding transcription factor DksA